MSDFDKAGKIRRGELDDELPDYEVLTGWIQRLPETWLPGMLFRLVVACELQQVFQEGGMERAIQRARAYARDPAQSVLRKEATGDE